MRDDLDSRVAKPDLRSAMIESIESRDHRIVVIDSGAALPDEIAAQMEADGYEFAFSPAAENGKRKIYFERVAAPAFRT